MKIFLSSTYEDLKEYRRIAINYLMGITGDVKNSTGEIVAMEFFSASEQTCKEECIKRISECDLIIGIYGERYGSEDGESGVSMTEIEYNYAKMNNIPILVFVRKLQTYEQKQEEFINKVFGASQLCAQFEDEEEFLNKLDNCLRSYFVDFEGFSVSSLWEQVVELKKELETYKGGLFPIDLQMTPYTQNQVDVALSDIKSSLIFIKSIISNLATENHMIYEYAYNCEFYPERTKECVDRMLQSIEENASDVLKNWESIHLGMSNHVTHALLAVAYLEVHRMQNRLLTEVWSQELRLEVIRVRNQYIDAIRNSRYVD